MGLEEFKRAAEKLGGVKISRQEPMSRHTSFKIGGPAYFITPGSGESMAELWRLALNCDIKPLVIGNGTNLLVTDGELTVPVISTAGLGDIRQTGDREIACQAGASMARAAAFAAELGLTGLEFAHGIPGSIGGGIFMNAGAYGGELKDAAVKTVYIDGSGQVRELCGDEQGFSYRHSAFSGGGSVILETHLRLGPGEISEIRGKMAELAAKRRTSQPLDMPSAGSTFKRPKEGYAAALIDQAGLKGFAIGGAQVSEKHGGFVVNRGGATCEDVLRVIEHVQSEVMRQFGVELEPEVRIVR
jgi:UDP-N-acetylmuramate dehydrogenase